MPESPAISSSSPRPLRPITEALARRLDALLGNLEDKKGDATLYIDIRYGKLWHLDVKQGIDLSDAQ